MDSDDVKRIVPNEEDENVEGESSKKRKEKRKKTREERKTDRKVIVTVLLLVVMVTALFYLLPKFEGWKMNGFSIKFGKQQGAPKWGSYTEVKF